MAATNPESKLRSRALDIMQGFTESAGMRIDAQEKATAENTKAIGQLGNKLDKLADSINAQKESIDRLERAVTSLVSGINAQRETMAQMTQQQGEFLKLATRQADIIGSLTAGKAG